MNIEQKIEEKIQSLYGELITDDDWKEHINRSIHKFFHDTGQYNRDRTPFDRLLQSKLTLVMSDRMDAYFRSDRWNKAWIKDGHKQVTKAVQEMIFLKVEDFVKDYFRGVVQAISQKITNEAYMAAEDLVNRS